MLRRLFSIVGRGAIVTTLLEDVFPTIDLSNPAPEFRALGGEFLAFGQGTRASAEFNAITLHNPVGSGVICIVDEVIINNSGIDVHMGINQIALGSVGVNKQFRDTRISGPTGLLVPVVQILSGNDIAGDIFPDTIRQVDTVPINFRLDQPSVSVAILTPGFTLGVESAIANTTLRANFLWRERSVDPSELNL